MVFDRNFFSHDTQVMILTRILLNLGHGLLSLHLSLLQLGLHLLQVCLQLSHLFPCLQQLYTCSRKLLHAMHIKLSKHTHTCYMYCNMIEFYTCF